jgi:hypothetical protein
MVDQPTMSKTPTTIVDAVNDKLLFASHFKDRWFGPKGTWEPWLAFLSAAFALPMDDAHLALFKQCTGLDAPPAERVKECWLVCGRRSGKSRMLALIACYLATLVDWSRYLSGGEPGVIQIVAGDRAQAQVIFRFLSSFLKGSKVLKPLIGRQTAESIELKNGISIEIATASFKTIRGRTVVAALLDELAFWSVDGSNPDSEIVAAIRPSMLTVPNSMLLVASSPYAQRGALWEAYRKHYAKPGKVLVWRAATTVMNPSIPQAEVDAALEEDPEKNKAEYLAQFRSDLESFVGIEVINAVTVQGRYELPPEVVKNPIAFIDVSGGAADSHTAAIAFKNADNVAVLAALLEKQGGNTEGVVQDFVALLRRYGVSTFWSDHYAKDWVRDAFARHGVELRYSTLNRSELYLELLPALRSGQVELLDLPKLRNQLQSLERSTTRTGRDSVNHPPGAHDDLINAAAGALVMAAAADRNKITWTLATGNSLWSSGSGRTVPEHQYRSVVYTGEADRWLPPVDRRIATNTDFLTNGGCDKQRE